MNQKDIKFKRLTLDFPMDLVEQIDIICDETFISRRKWFIDAAIKALERDKLDKIDRVVRK